MKLSHEADRLRLQILMAAYLAEAGNMAESLAITDILSALFLGEHPVATPEELMILAPEATLAQYALLSALGHIPTEELYRFAQLGSPLSEYPLPNVHPNPWAGYHPETGLMHILGQAMAGIPVHSAVFSTTQGSRIPEGFLSQMAHIAPRDFLLITYGWANSPHARYTHEKAFDPAALHQDGAKESLPGWYIVPPISPDISLEEMQSLFQEARTHEKPAIVHIPVSPAQGVTFLQDRPHLMHRPGHMGEEDFETAQTELLERLAS